MEDPVKVCDRPAQLNQAAMPAHHGSLTDPALLEGAVISTPQLHHVVGRDHRAWIRIRGPWESPRIQSGRGML
jgi:hypothetical protein